MASRHLNLFLLSEDVDEPADVLRVKYPLGEAVDAHEAKLGDTAGTLLLKRQRRNKPAWVKFLTDERIVTEETIGSLRNQSTAALLVFKAAGRHFALSFGYGRSMLEPEKYEDDFGLKVVLCAVDPDRLTSIDAKTFEERTLQQRKQVSDSAPVSSFGIDIERDIVRAVAGRPSNSSLGTSISGADALLLTIDIEAKDIPALCESVFHLYERGDLPERFKWVDNVKRVKGPELIERLDVALVDLLNAGEWDNIHLAAPQVLDPGKPKHFEFSVGPATEMDDPSISSYMAVAPRASKISRGQLGSHRLEAIDEESDQQIDDWPIYRCIVAEIETGDERYVLSGGQWYQVNEDFRESVIASIRAIDPVGFEFPECGARETEDQFNERVAAETDAALLHKGFVYLSGQDKFELCDLLLPQNGRLVFFHVKKRGSSSTLSHLFNQGLNSAEMLVNDQSCREQARDLIKKANPGWEDGIALDGVSPSEVEVCFAVVTRGRNGLPLTLPFFSLVSLKNAASRLKNRGYSVSVATIPQQPPGDGS